MHCFVSKQVYSIYTFLIGEDSEGYSSGLNHVDEKKESQPQLHLKQGVSLTALSLFLSSEWTHPGHILYL